jgi:adenylate cyclase
MRLHRNFLTRATAIGLVLLVVLGASALWLADPLPMQSLRLAQFDQFQRWQPREGKTSSVPIVDIDEASLKAYGQWPWPRTRLAELVQRLHAAGATVIAFDVLLAEPDRTSPHAMAQLWQNPQASAALQALPDHDDALAAALAGRGVVLGSSLSHAPPVAPVALVAGGVDAAGLPWRIVSSGAGTPLRWLHSFESAVWPLPVLRSSASGLGAMNFAADGDAVVRRVPLFLRLGEQIVPSLSAETLRVAQGTRNYLLRSGAEGFQDVRIGAITVPTSAQAEVWLDFGRAPRPRFVSATQVLGGTLAAGELRGRIVLVGSSAAGLMDTRANPLGQLMPGVQAQAMALEQMLSGVHLQRPAWAVSAEALALLTGALLVGLVALRASFKTSALLAMVMLAALMATAWYAFAAQHLLLDASNPALAVLLSFGLASGVHHLASEREQRWLRQAFSRYVSPNRVAHLMAHPEQLQLNGQRQVCSFVFTDLAGFTQMIETSDPAQMVAFINDYLEGMLAIVFRHEGTLDRIMGDALVVMFSAPVVQLDHRQRALACALEMHVFASAYAERLQAGGVAWGHTRIGVHCGEVIVGNFGGRALFDYRALGDPINTAARLETVNKHLGTRMCISQAILEGCPGVLARPVGRLVLKGKSQWLQAYEPLGACNVAACAPSADYAAAMQLLQAGDASQAALALMQFEALAARHPLDPLVALHLRRLRAGAIDDLIVLDEK